MSGDMPSREAITRALKQELREYYEEGDPPLAAVSSVSIESWVSRIIRVVERARAEETQR